MSNDKLLKEDYSQIKIYPKEEIRANTEWQIALSAANYKLKQRRSIVKAPLMESEREREKKKKN